jgi:hypothetical protein
VKALIAVVTQIPRFYYEVVKGLRKKNIEFLSLGLAQEIPPGVKVVITTQAERERVAFPQVIACDDPMIAIEEAIRILRGLKTAYKNLVIGIDPGVKPGVAVSGDDMVIQVHHLTALEDIVGVVKNTLGMYNGEKTIIRVGKGGGIYRNRILMLLQKNFDLTIELVDETSTTPALGKETGLIKDIVAAINIALKKGQVLKGKVDLAPKMGEIKNIQKESRALSGNITISKKLAEKVAKGELTVEEAVELQRRNSRIKK